MRVEGTAQASAPGGFDTAFPGFIQAHLLFRPMSILAIDQKSLSWPQLGLRGFDRAIAANRTDLSRAAAFIHLRRPSEGIQTLRAIIHRFAADEVFFSNAILPGLAHAPRLSLFRRALRVWLIQPAAAKNHHRVTAFHPLPRSSPLALRCAEHGERDCTTTRARSKTGTLQF